MAAIPPKRPLLYVRSTRRNLALAAASGIVVLASTELAHWVIAGHRTLRNSLPDLLVAILVVYLAYLVLSAQQQRRLRAVEELTMIADMNHHIRNALDLLATSAYTFNDKAAVAVIQKASERIMYALREVLPGKDKGLR